MSTARSKMTKEGRLQDPVEKATTPAVEVAGPKIRSDSTDFSTASGRPIDPNKLSKNKTFASLISGDGVAPSPAFPISTELETQKEKNGIDLDLARSVEKEGVGPSARPPSLTTAPTAQQEGSESTIISEDAATPASVSSKKNLKEVSKKLSYAQNNPYSDTKKQKVPSDPKHPDMINHNNKTVGWTENLRALNTDLSRLVKEEKEMNDILRIGKMGDTEENRNKVHSIREKQDKIKEQRKITKNYLELLRKWLENKEMGKDNSDLNSTVPDSKRYVSIFFSDQTSLLQKAKQQKRLLIPNGTDKSGTKPGASSEEAIVIADSTNTPSQSKNSTFLTSPDTNKAINEMAENVDSVVQQRGLIISTREQNKNNTENNELTTHNSKFFVAQQHTKKYDVNMEFSIDSSKVDGFLNKPFGTIDYENGTNPPLKPCFDDRIFRALNPITTNVCKSTALALLEVDNNTFNLTETVDSYEQPDFSPQSCRLKFSLDRPEIFNNKGLALLEQHRKAARDNIQKYHDAQKEVLKLDKIECLRLSQEESRNRTIKGIWNIADSFARETAVLGLKATVMDLNEPYSERKKRKNDSKEEGKSDTASIASFAFLILFLAPNSCMALSKYMCLGKEAMLNKAASFLIKIRPLTADTTETKTTLRLGHLIFKKPHTAILERAMKIAEDMVNPIIHITLEQRNVFLRQLSISRSIMAVLKCGVKSEMITASMQVADIIKNSGHTNNTVCHEHNLWRRSTTQSFKELLVNARRDLNNQVTKLSQEIADLQVKHKEKEAETGINTDKRIAKNKNKNTTNCNQNSPITSINVPSNNENNTTITHQEPAVPPPHSPISSLTEKESISGSTSNSKNSKQQRTNATSTTSKTKQHRQHNEDAAAAAQAAKEASKLERELETLQEQMNAKKRAAEEARKQSNSRHKNLAQKRKREETNQQREDDDASVARQRREQRHSNNKHTYGRGFNGGRTGRGRGRDGGRGGRGRGRFLKN